MLLRMLLPLLLLLWASPAPLARAESPDAIHDLQLQVESLKQRVAELEAAGERTTVRRCMGAVGGAAA